jgi:hypothetical protein
MLKVGINDGFRPVSDGQVGGVGVSRSAKLAIRPDLMAAVRE